LGFRNDFCSGRSRTYARLAQCRIIERESPREESIACDVVYHPEYYGIAPFEHLPDIGEVIAYGINEGRVTQDTVELDDGTRVQWSVKPESIKALRRWRVI
jgi:hypothetical protein